MNMIPKGRRKPIQTRKIRTAKVNIVSMALLSCYYEPYAFRIHSWQIYNYLELPKSLSVADETKSHDEYYSLKIHREGPNTESGELDSKSQSKEVKDHNKAMGNRYDKRWICLIHQHGSLGFTYIFSPCSMNKACFPGTPRRRASAFLRLDHLDCVNWLGGFDDASCSVASGFDHCT